VRANGIDVLAVHPSPVASHFFENAHKLESLEMAQKSAVSPASVPGKMLTCVGRGHLGNLHTNTQTFSFCYYLFCCYRLSSCCFCWSFAWYC
jgi:short-subunit dehydrogenase